MNNHHRAYGKPAIRFQRGWLRLHFLMGVLCMAALAGYPFLAGAQSLPNKDLPTPKLVRVANSLYTIENANATLDELRAFGGNVIVYVTDEGVLLVDTKFAPMHDFIVEQVASLTDLPIKLVVVTHNHADHSGGVDAMQAIGATAIVSAADREHMLHTAESPPQIAYSGHLELLLGGQEVKLIELRGHTQGDTVAYFPAERVVAAGDLVTTATTIPTLVNYADGGTWSDLDRALDAIAALDFDYLVGGHGPVITKEAFLRHRANLRAMTGRLRELTRAGADQDEIAATLLREFQWGEPASGNIPGMMQELR